MEKLRKLEWDVQTAHEAGMAHKIVEDQLVHYATTQERIFLTFDELRGEHGERVSRELRENGGKVIKVGGGPAQDPYRAVGKLLFHYPVWHAFFNAQDGVAAVEDLKGCKTFRPDEYHHKYHSTDARQFDAYLEARKKQTRARPKRKKKPADPSQLSMA
ncbi:MAG: hypothetical protein HY675_27745 [Chloroflexi bacterium]|nr:hypothetical protein [Chloroflexota bacterium]